MLLNSLMGTCLSTYTSMTSSGDGTTHFRINERHIRDTYCISRELLEREYCIS